MMTGTEAEYQSDAGSTKDTPYLALTGELWGVFYENKNKKNGHVIRHHTVFGFKYFVLFGVHYDF